MAKCKNCVVGLLGPCNDYCQPEREGLIEEARRRAGQLGHVLAEFVKVKDYAIWEARCERCGRVAAITLDPPLNEPDVYGEAVVARCTERGE